MFFLIVCLLFHYVRWNFDERYAPDMGLGCLYKIKASKKRNAWSRTFYYEGHGPEIHVVIARARRERWKSSGPVSKCESFQRVLVMSPYVFL